MHIIRSITFRLVAEIKNTDEVRAPCSMLVTVWPSD